MFKPSVIIAEDVFMQATEISRMLQECNCHVVGQTDNGPSTIELAKHLNPDVVIMDIELKGEMSGIQAARIIHKELSIPIIYLTMDDSESRYTEARRDLKAEYIPKPYKRVHILNALDNIFSRYWEYSPTRHSKLFARSKQGSSNTFVCFNVVDISFIQGHGKECTIFLEENQHTISSPLQQVEKKLIKLDQFVKANRSQIVNVEKIHEMVGKTAAKSLRLMNRQEIIPVSVKYQKQVLSRLYRI